eukprot:6592783-Prymnesium_polylepis.1
MHMCQGSDRPAHTTRTHSRTHRERRVENYRRAGPAGTRRAEAPPPPPSAARGAPASEARLRKAGADRLE